MSEVRKGLLYSGSHYWVEEDDEGVVRIGLTDFGQAELGEINGIQLPEPGESVDGDTSVGEIDASDAAHELVSPLTGTVIEVNEDLADSPSLINEEPYGDGWLFTLQLTEPDEMDDLMSVSEYKEFLESEIGEDVEDE